MRKLWFLPIAVGLLLPGCVTVPMGPNVLVLPGNGKDFEQFKVDDAECRQWALQQVGTTTAKASTESTVTGAAVGTVLGAATGAALGAASGHAATGAAVGSGVGLLGGTAVGADRGASAQWSVQRRYDMAYTQCMYSKGNQVPIPGGIQRPSASTWQPPPGASPPTSLPPPPAGSPPPPPPGSAW
ncbi:MAG: glycine zipper family protein [Candidatus Binatia bacterium]